MARTVFGVALEGAIKEMDREELVRTHLYIHVEPFQSPTPEQRAAAEAWADKIDAACQTLDVLEALAPKPCSECGR